MSLLGRSISTRLIRTNLIVSGAVLLLATLGFFAYDQVTVRTALIRSNTAQARLTAHNVVSALTFNDPDAAQTTLSAFASSATIESATLVTPSGAIFARYSRSPNLDPATLPPIPAGQETASWNLNKGLLVAQQIKLRDDVIGAVYLRSNLGILQNRPREYGLIAGLVFLLSLLAVVPFSRAFRRSIEAPISELAGTAQKVIRERDYTIQSSAKAEADELRILIDSFNQMLDEVRERDQRLVQAAAELEQRVEDRTHQLAAANREMEAFSYSVSHDLRGPLETMNGFTYMLLEQYGARLDAEGRSYLEQVRSASSRMSQLIDDLLKLSHISGGALHRERVDIGVAARQVAAELQQREPRRSVRFIFHDCVPAEGDSRMLLIVLENLISNAWKYTSQQAEAVIEVGCRSLSSGGNMYFVRDNGAGFETKLSDRLFKPFQRLHSLAEFPGNGIGLATVQRIINRHGGRVWAEGAVGQGATFYFTLRPHQAAETLRKSM